MTHCKSQDFSLSSWDKSCFFVNEEVCLNCFSHKKLLFRLNILYLQLLNCASITSCYLYHTFDTFFCGFEFYLFRMRWSFRTFYLTLWSLPIPSIAQRGQSCSFSDSNFLAGCRLPFGGDFLHPPAYMTVFKRSVYCVVWFSFFDQVGLPGLVLPALSTFCPVSASRQTFLS